MLDHAIDNLRVAIQYIVANPGYHDAHKYLPFLEDAAHLLNMTKKYAVNTHHA